MDGQPSDIPGNETHEAGEYDDLAFWPGVWWALGAGLIVTAVCLGIGKLLWSIL